MPFIAIRRIHHKINYILYRLIPMRSGRKARILSDGELLQEVFTRFGDQVVIGVSKELAGQYGVAAKAKKKR